MYKGKKFKTSTIWVLAINVLLFVVLAYNTFTKGNSGLGYVFIVFGLVNLQFWTYAIYRNKRTEQKEVK